MGNVSQSRSCPLLSTPNMRSLRKGTFKCYSMLTAVNDTTVLLFILQIRNPRTQAMVDMNSTELYMEPKKAERGTTFIGRSGADLEIRWFRNASIQKPRGTKNHEFVKRSYNRRINYHANSGFDIHLSASSCEQNIASSASLSDAISPDNLGTAGHISLPPCSTSSFR